MLSVGYDLPLCIALMKNASASLQAWKTSIKLALLEHKHHVLIPADAPSQCLCSCLLVATLAFEQQFVVGHVPGANSIQQNTMQELKP